MDIPIYPKKGFRKIKRNVGYIQKEGINEILECGDGYLREKAKGYLALRQKGRWIRMDSMVRSQGARETGKLFLMATLI